MSVLIPFLIALNIFLATAIFVAKIALMDRRYARQVQEEQRYRSHFRSDRRD